MNTLPQDLINKIMLYVSHPCAAIMYGALIPREDVMTIIMTPARIERPNRHCGPNVFVFRGKTTKKEEYWYESDVVERHIHNNFQIRCLNTNRLERIKQISHFICYRYMLIEI